MGTKKLTPKRTPKRARKRKNRVREWRPLFLRELAACGNISRTARKARITRRYAYEAREADPEFAKAWNDALEIACDAMEEEARRRAIKGTDEGVFYQGRKVAKLIRYSDTLLMFLLKAYRPKFRDRVTVENCSNLNRETAKLLPDDELKQALAGTLPPAQLAMIIAARQATQ